MAHSALNFTFQELEFVGLAWQVDVWVGWVPWGDPEPRT